MSESDCMVCFHRDICKSPRILICKNYEFSRSDAQDCYKCLKRFDCIKGIDLLLFDCGHFVNRSASFCAEDRELAEARAEIEALVAEFKRIADEPPTLEEIAADLDKIEMLTKQLAAARADYAEMNAERIKWLGDNMRQAKLIERMADALGCAIAVLPRGYKEREKCEAALSAAERGGK